MSPHRAYEDHMCSTATMTRGAWRTLAIALSTSVDVECVTDIPGSEEILYSNGTVLHVIIEVGF